MTYDEAKVYAWQAFQSRQPSLEDVIYAIRNAVNAQTAKLERELKETDLLLESELSRKTADGPYSVRMGMDRALPEDLPEWLRDFTDRERDEIKFAQVYAIQFAHGTDGHSRLILIAKLADKLNTSELMRLDPQALEPDTTKTSPKRKAAA